MHFYYTYSRAILWLLTYSIKTKILSMLGTGYFNLTLSQKLVPAKQKNRQSAKTNPRKNFVPHTVCMVRTGVDPGFFLGGGALISCSTPTPRNHIVFFWQNTSCIRKPQDISVSGGGGGGAPPAPPPPKPPQQENRLLICFQPVFTSP